MKNMSKMKKGIITTAVVVIVAVVGIAGVVMNPNYKYRKVNSLVADGKFDEAVAVCEKLITSENKAEVQAKIAKVKVLKESTYSFNIGMTEFNSESYKDAYYQFTTVPKEDTKNYDNASDKIKQCIDLENKQAIAQAELSVSKLDYQGALYDIEPALDIDKDNKQLLDLKGKYIKLNEESKAKASEEFKTQLFNENGILTPKQEEAKSKGATVGMTKQECLDSSWGNPEDINKTTTASGVSEQWVYSSNRYLYFEDGILTTIQD